MRLDQRTIDQALQAIRRGSRSSTGAGGGSGRSVEFEIKAFLDACGLSEYHELFLSPKAGNCKRPSQVARMNTKRQIRAAARKLPAFRAMTDEQCEQVAAAVMKK